MSIHKISKQFKCITVSLLIFFVTISLVTPQVKAAEQNSISAGQSKTHSPSWFPEQLLEWSPDDNTVYNVSHIPLAKRIETDKLTPSNDNQSKDVEVVAISIMNESTSGNPSQGSKKFSSNTFSYWQYIDKMVYWGGSASEGLIVPPSPDVTDSAHKNGVPVFGTVFFPQEEHGGKIEWLREFLVKTGDTFPVADKLIEVANTLKFDGWFINQETQGATESYSKLMQEFIQYIKAKAPKLEIMWYDSMVTDGQLKWQNALTKNNQMFLIDSNDKPVADSMFLNFWWNTDKLASEELLKLSKENALKLKLNPYNLFAGIDIQAEGTNTPVMWDLYSKENSPYTSLGLYCPSWTFFSSNSVEEFLEKEKELWVNKSGDPRILSEDDGWKGISNYAVEKSPVTSVPFVTNFSMGNGNSYFVNGARVSSQPWNNRSLQDIMPTYRWIIDNTDGNLMNAQIDYSDAFNGGNSIKLSGKLKGGNSTIKLYAADINVLGTIKFSTVAKTSSEKMSLDLVLDFYDGTNGIIESKILEPNQWEHINYDLSDYKGKVIKNISFRVHSNNNLENASINIGNISIINNSMPAEINKVILENTFSDDSINADISITIDAKNEAKNVNRYEIYQVDNNQLVGATVNPNYYISEVKRNGKNKESKFRVVAVDKTGERSAPSEFVMYWGNYPTPKADFSVDKTLVAPDEEITLTNLSSNTTENIEWVFNGADIKSSNENTPKIKYKEEGSYTIKLIAKNSSGENQLVKENIILVTKEASEKTDKLAFEKTGYATSSVNEKEAANFAFDNSLETKWCAVGNGPHAITADLEGIYTVSQVDISHAGAGGENSSFNTKDYTISTSIDGVNFTDVSDVKDNTADVSHNPIKPTKAKYVRVTINKATQGGDMAARIYDIKIIGLEI